MSDESGEGVWFRRITWGLGYNFVPVSWQGWAATLAFIAAIMVTVFAGDPSMARPSNAPLFLKVKGLFGLAATHLPLSVMTMLIVAEVIAFLLIIWWKSRVLRPLD